MYKEILHMGDQSTCQSVLIIATILYFCMVVFVMIVFVMFVFVEFVFFVVVFNRCCCQHNYHHHYKKNPAYGRPQISRPMLIEASIQRETYKDFFLLWGICLIGGGLLCTLQQSTSLHFYILYYTALLSHAVHFTEKLEREKYIYIYSFNAQQFNFLDCIELHRISIF